MAQQFQLSDGRTIDYVVNGPKEGFPFVWIHGTPGGYIPTPELLKNCEKKNIKLISASRAGYGGSTRNKGRRVVDAVADIHALNQHLGVNQCVVGGWSGGGPHALACAARLPGCLAVLSVASLAPKDAKGLDWIAGQGQDNIDEFNALLEGEDALRKFCEAHRSDLLQADAAGVVEVFSTIMPPVDSELLFQGSSVSQNMVDSMHEALRIGVDGWIDDDMAFMDHWGFELDEIKVPVLLYQGNLDITVPYTHGLWLGENLPQKALRKHLVEGQGHISIFIGQGEKIIDELLEAANVAWVPG